MQVLLIIALSVAAAVVYGILHDQVTVRVCVEYFTIGHPPVFRTDSPTLLALGWGVIATWWVGLILGVPLAPVARAGRRYPKVDAASLVRPLGVLMGVMAAVALAAGVAGYVLAGSEAVFLVAPLADAVPRDKHVAFIADLWAHVASYVAGFLGGIVLMARTWFVRRRRAAGVAMVSP